MILILQTVLRSSKVNQWHLRVILQKCWVLSGEHVGGFGEAYTTAAGHTAQYTA